MNRVRNDRDSDSRDLNSVDAFPMPGVLHVDDNTPTGSVGTAMASQKDDHRRTPADRKTCGADSRSTSEPGSRNATLHVAWRPDTVASSAGCKSPRLATWHVQAVQPIPGLSPRNALTAEVLTPASSVTPTCVQPRHLPQTTTLPTMLTHRRATSCQEPDAG